MTIDIKAIRDVALVTADSERMRFKPSTIIALLDRLEAAEKDAAPAVEPVAEVHQKMVGGNSFPGTGIRWLEGAPLVPVGSKLYTSPPPPAEVPLLTNEEIDDLFARITEEFDAGKHDYESVAFARAIEAAVRQKAGL